MVHYTNQDGTKTFHSTIDGIGVKSYKEITIDTLGVVKIEKIMNSSSKSANKVTTLFKRLSAEDYIQKLINDDNQLIQRRLDANKFHLDVIDFHQSLINEHLEKINSFKVTLIDYIELLDSIIIEDIIQFINDRLSNIDSLQTIIDEHYSLLVDVQLSRN